MTTNELTPCHEGHFENNNYIFFWNGPFSNWYHSEFQINNLKFNCAEQAMMYFKALQFNDEDIANKILKTDCPKKQKALGRSIKNYNDDEWSNVRFQIVSTLLLSKFNQNDYLKNILLATGTRTIVEASPYDKIWGIGMGVGDPDILDENKWNGENLLGKALMAVRHHFLTNA